MLNNGYVPKATNKIKLSTYTNTKVDHKNPKCKRADTMKHTFQLSSEYVCMKSIVI